MFYSIIQQSMARYWLILLVSFSLLTEHAAQAQSKLNGVDINLLPMYGGARKPKRLQLADELFLATTDRNEPNRAVAAKHFVKRGMDYFRAGDYATAMKRFNQAWLLDSTNADTYWGFGILRGSQGDYNESITLLSNSLKRQPDNQNLTADLAGTLLQRYDAFRANADLERSLALFELYVSRENNASGNESRIPVYAALAMGYFRKQDYERAWQWTDRARQLNPAAVDPTFLRQLRQAAPRQ
ncbi:hypothetical protein [Hymenobacter koreensis]|uniref:Tetratricopeptide repeat protein n=1 Tax=Hymenobacter koreensis TaxID=1084523 RepID=A0ABP8J7J0_9BACT